MSTKDDEFDIAFLGLGVSSLIHLHKNLEDYKSKKIIVFEREERLNLSKNICGFWDHTELPMTHKWKSYRLYLKGETFTPDSHFYARLNLEKMFDEIIKSLNIVIKFNCSCDEMEEENNFFAIRGRINSEIQLFHAKYVYDSRPLALVDKVLKQNFLGYEYIFQSGHNLQSPVIMNLDESHPSGNDLFFFYLLPLTEKKVLVEATTYTMKKLDEALLEDELMRFMASNFNDQDFKIERKEIGSLPLIIVKNEYRSIRYQPLGVRAGMMRAATGYSAAMVDSGQNYGGIKGIFLSSLDRFFLKVMARPEVNKNDVFEVFLSKMSDNHFTSFMSARPSFLSLVKAILSMPKLIFLKSIFRKTKNKTLYVLS